MSDTNTANPATAQPIQRRPRLKDALAIGTTSVIESGCKGLNAAAALLNGMATRVTLHNTGVFLDMVEDQNGDSTKVVTAVNTVLQIGKSI